MTPHPLAALSLAPAGTVAQLRHRARAAGLPPTLARSGRRDALLSALAGLEVALIWRIPDVIGSRCNSPSLDRLKQLQSALMVEVQAQQNWDDAVEQLARDAEAAAESGADLAARLALASRWFSACWISCTPEWIARSCRVSGVLMEPVMPEPPPIADQVVAVRRARTEGLKHLTQLQRPVAIEPVIPDDVAPESPQPSDEVERARLARLERIRRRPPAPAPAETLPPVLERPTPALVPAVEPDPPTPCCPAAPAGVDQTWFSVAEAGELLGLGIRAVQRRRQLGLFGEEGCGWFRRGRACYISPEAVELQAKKTSPLISGRRPSWNPAISVLITP